MMLCAQLCSREGTTVPIADAKAVKRFSGLPAWRRLAVKMSFLLKATRARQVSCKHAAA